jgi:hypothetical protein
MPTRPKKPETHHRSSRSKGQPAASNFLVSGIIVALLNRPDTAHKLVSEARVNDLFLKLSGLSKSEAKLLPRPQLEARVLKRLFAMPLAEQNRLFTEALALLSPEQYKAMREELKQPEKINALLAQTIPQLRDQLRGDPEWDQFFDRYGTDWLFKPPHIDPFDAAHMLQTLIPSAAPPIIKPPENHIERQMREQAKKSFVHDGVRYWPLSFAAPLAQVHRTTLLHWIKNKIEVAGKPIQSYYFAPSDQYFISDESIKRAADRFIKWQDGKPAGPAGPAILGETKDKSGYIGLPEARGILGISNRTMYLWATRGKAPTDSPLDIIKDPVSDHLYIREKDVYELKKLVPRSGLQRGRRPQPALQP